MRRDIPLEDVPATEKDHTPEENSRLAIFVILVCLAAALALVIAL